MLLLLPILVVGGVVFAATMLRASRGGGWLVLTILGGVVLLAGIGAIVGKEVAESEAESDFEGGNLESALDAAELADNLDTASMPLLAVGVVLVLGGLIWRSSATSTPAGPAFPGGSPAPGAPFPPGASPYEGAPPPPVGYGSVPPPPAGYAPAAPPASFTPAATPYRPPAGTGGPTHCANCGQERQPNGTFCLSCGRRFDGT